MLYNVLLGLLFAVSNLNALENDKIFSSFQTDYCASFEEKPPSTLVQVCKKASSFPELKTLAQAWNAKCNEHTENIEPSPANLAFYYAKCELNTEKLDLAAKAYFKGARLAGCGTSDSTSTGAGAEGRH